MKMKTKKNDDDVLGDSLEITQLKMQQPRKLSSSRGRAYSNNNELGKKCNKAGGENKVCSPFLFL